ncbi:hypothetical protein FRC14_003797 [Serendipita sp. 396]|nr:hypothetical protein FRC14_003797 [Serendipita sp. 396]KAG8782830.1 hypothetical protein FRC15_006216 [Serendipita sp. 397]KAG8793206.1 hypothetical protein FRC16_011050 [Serendipita sp. 398]KAG8820054.1 hypothetical protein FRC19_009184 [Serendipita sp. 401]KAG8840253.1 hypothetical protein FRB91_006374 [Serendipita sp. 411]KAG8867177.1 hypothetical protein FRC20_006527 [Serendipita sp. 405]
MRDRRATYIPSSGDERTRSIPRLLSQYFSYQISKMTSKQSPDTISDYSQSSTTVVEGTPGQTRRGGRSSVTSSLINRLLYLRSPKTKKEDSEKKKASMVVPTPLDKSKADGKKTGNSAPYHHTHGGDTHTAHYHAATGWGAVGGNDLGGSSSGGYSGDGGGASSGGGGDSGGGGGGGDSGGGGGGGGD